MSARVLPLRTPADSRRGQGWKRRFERWCALVEACTRKPSRRRVHSLRAETLRLQAGLDPMVHSGVLSTPSQRLVRRWIRVARRVRRLLAPIRDTDVCLEILKTFRSPGAVEAAAESPDACDYLHAIQALESALRARRKASGRQMVRVLKARLFRITDSARSLGKGLDGADGAHCDSRAALQALMDELAAAAPTLTPAGLHSFRKLAKKGRYLAEFMPHPDAWTQEADSTCRSIQRAVGQWRDWAALARFARRNVRGAGPVLTRQLACTASRLLQEALCQCRQPIPGPAERTRRQPVRRYVRVARRPA